VRIRESYSNFFLLALIPEYGDIYSKILLQYFVRRMTQVIFKNLNQPAILHYVLSFNNFTKVTRAKVIPDTILPNALLHESDISQLNLKPSTKIG
jgi:hypothetical protein